MEEMFNLAELKSLTELLSSTSELQQETTEDQTAKYADNPNFKVNIRKITGSSDTSKQNETTNNERQLWCIWDEDEISQMNQVSAVPDPREIPEYQISYSQAVTTADIYLQMSHKTPSSVSCEHMIVTIFLPQEESAADIEADLSDRQLDIRSIRYRLCLPLPHPVLTSACKSQWDPTSHALKITLALKREFDFLNF